MAAAAAVAAGVAAVTGCSSPNPSGFYGTGSPQEGLDQGSDSGNENGDATSMITFYGIANPIIDAGPRNTDGPGVPPRDAGSDAGGDAQEDAPSAVAFYGIANPVDAGGEGGEGGDASG